MRAAVAGVGLWLALTAPTVPACGYCIEDQIAAAYDQAVVNQALARQHHVAFFHLDAPPAPDAETHRRLTTLAESMPGVDRGSVRISAETSALSLAFDPQRLSPGKLRQRLASHLVMRGFSVELLRVMEKPAEFKASGRK